MDRRTGWLKAVNTNERGVQIDASTAVRPEIEDIQAGIQAGAKYAVTLMVDGKGPDKVIFVADDSPLIGAPVPTKAHLWGRDFEVRLDDAGRVRSYDLSGSCTSLVECMNLATNWGIPRNTVERAVTDNAVPFLKPSLDRLGIELDKAPEHSAGIVFRNGPT